MKRDALSISTSYSANSTYGLQSLYEDSSTAHPPSPSSIEQVRDHSLKCEQACERPAKMFKSADWSALSQECVSEMDAETSSAIESLPEDVLKLIFSFLPDMPVEEVCSLWKHTAGTLYTLLLNNALAGLSLKRKSMLEAHLKSKYKLADTASPRLKLYLLHRDQMERVRSISHQKFQIGEENAERLETGTFAETEQWIADFSLAKLCSMLLLGTGNDIIDVMLIWQAANQLVSGVIEDANADIHEQAEMIRQALECKRDVIKIFLANDLSLLEIPEKLCSLTTLKQIDLSSNKLFQLPDDIGNLKNLNLINLAQNCLNELPKGFANLSNLQTCCLDGNRLECIPEVLCRLPKLKDLHLSYNRIKSIPEALDQLTMLEKLHLQGNDINQFPKSLASLKNLTYLSLAENNLKTIPKVIFSIPKLKKLFIAHNQLSSLPSCKGKALTLEQLDMSDNCFSALPQEILKLTHLKILDISYNPLTSIPTEIFSLPKLNELLISQNQEKLLAADTWENRIKILVKSDELNPIFCALETTVVDDGSDEDNKE